MGFKKGCRSVIGLDGCFVKGKHLGQILATIGIDANNGMFPLAYVVVEIENEDTWEWFLKMLIGDLGMSNTHGYAFITNKQKWLINAIQTLMPNAKHRLCVRHLHNNFKKIHSGLALKQTLWEAARATTIPWFQSIMDKLKEDNEEAWKWLDDKPPGHWSKSYFSTYFKCDILANNLCKAFNKSIVKARDKPILTMLQMIRKNLMVRMANRRVATLKCKGVVGPRIEKIIDKLKNERGICLATLAGDMKYQVQHLHGWEFAVDLGARTCSCRKWDI
ncbi:hypothetical protein ACFX1X_038735 [Malus domestica]